MQLQLGKDRFQEHTHGAQRGEASGARGLAALRPRVARGFMRPARSRVSALAAIAMAVATLEAMVALPAKLESADVQGCALPFARTEPSPLSSDARAVPRHDTASEHTNDLAFVREPHDASHFRD